MSSLTHIGPLTDDFQYLPPALDIQLNSGLTCTNGHSTDLPTYLTDISNLTNSPDIPLRNLFLSAFLISKTNHSLLPAVRAKYPDVGLEWIFSLSHHTSNVAAKPVGSCKHTQNPATSHHLLCCLRGASHHCLSTGLLQGLPCFCSCPIHFILH